MPISEKQTKTFIGQKEPLSLELSMPVRGFVPGQTVPMEITVKNDSNVRVSKIRIVLKKVSFTNGHYSLTIPQVQSSICLFKVVTYHTREKSRTHKEIVVEIELPVTRKEETHFERFDIPSIPPTGMHYCTVIDVQYALKVEACVDLTEWYYRMLQKNLKIRTHVIVGTVPLVNFDDAIADEQEKKFNGLLPTVPCESIFIHQPLLCFDFFTFWIIF